jgi:hypothetical protein
MEIAEASGFNLAMGELQATGMAAEDDTMAADETTEDLDPDYELFLVPGLALFTLGVLFVSDKLLKGLYIGSAVAALIVMALYYLEMEGDIGDIQEAMGGDMGMGGLDVGYTLFWWLTIAVLVLMIGLGVVYSNEDY